MLCCALAGGRAEAGARSQGGARGQGRASGQGGACRPQQGGAPGVCQRRRDLLRVGARSDPVSLVLGAVNAREIPQKIFCRKIYRLPYCTSCYGAKLCINQTISLLLSCSSCRGAGRIYYHCGNCPCWHTCPGSILERLRAEDAGDR